LLPFLAKRVIDWQRQNIRIDPVIRYIARKPETWFIILKFLLNKASLQDAEKVFLSPLIARQKALLFLILVLEWIWIFLRITTDLKC